MELFITLSLCIKAYRCGHRGVRRIVRGQWVSPVISGNSVFSLSLGSMQFVSLVEHFKNWYTDG